MLEHLDTMIGFALVMLLMSLVVTILVQVVQTIVNLRGRNLVWGVERILDDLGYDEPREYAKRILKHPSVAGGRRVAHAIRSRELQQLLATVPAPDETQPQGRLVRFGLAVAKIFGYEPKAADALAEALKEQLQGLQNLTGQDLDAVEARVKEILTQQLANARAQIGDLKSTFDMVMDRTTERFVAHTRTITILIAFALCFGLQLDALRIFEQISTDAELRAALVERSEATLQQAEVVQADLDVPLASKAIAGMPAELEKLKNDTAPDDLDLDRIGELLPKLSNPPPGLVHRAEGRNWVRGRIEEEGVETALAFYEHVFGQVATGHLTVLLGHANDVKQSVDARLQLFERSGVFADLWVQPAVKWPIVTRHFLGVLLSAMLLSLGAPFWFNMLKTLSNLRPVLAGRVDEDEAGKPPAS